MAAALLREMDSLHFAELHPQEYAALRQALRPWHAKVHQQDGFELALSLAPPTPRRGPLLIDPSSARRCAYARTPGRICQLHRKCTVAVLPLRDPICKPASPQK